MKRFEFNIRELAGSMGDLGTLFPLVVGYIAICGLDPAGLLIMMGIANIATGIVYKLPMPIEPMKVIALTAIAQHWSPSMVYATGVATGLVWLVLAVSGLVDKMANLVPTSIVRAIQVTLGLLLAYESLKMLSTAWLMGIGAFIIILALKDNKYFPASIVLMLLGIVFMYVNNVVPEFESIHITVPGLAIFTIDEMWDGMVSAGFAQIPLTATNAVIATALLIKTYWPDSHVTEKHLSLNMGIMNLTLPLFGGMPLCHGAGGLAGQYSFGARTGGANIIEGTIEILLGLFLASSIAILFANFPVYIIGAMMLYVGLKLVKDNHSACFGKEKVPFFVTIAVALLSNMAVGFIAGLIIFYFMHKNK